jgi:hypothetical protein
MKNNAFEVSITGCSRLTKNLVFDISNHSVSLSTLSFQSFKMCKPYGKPASTGIQLNTRSGHQLQTRLIF